MYHFLCFKVRWGTSGNTEAALHLERGKQASVVGVIDIETEGEMVPERPPSPSPTRAPPSPPLPPAPKKKGCCSWISVSDRLSHTNMYNGVFA